MPCSCVGTAAMSHRRCTVRSTVRRWRRRLPFHSERQTLGSTASSWASALPAGATKYQWITPRWLSSVKRHSTELWNPQSLRAVLPARHVLHRTAPVAGQQRPVRFGDFPRGDTLLSSRGTGLCACCEMSPKGNLQKSISTIATNGAEFSVPWQQQGMLSGWRSSGEPRKLDAAFRQRHRADPCSVSLNPRGNSCRLS